MYNNNTQIIRVENTDGMIRLFDYDDTGNLIGVVNPDGSTIEYTYDTSTNLVRGHVQCTLSFYTK